MIDFYKKIEGWFDFEDIYLRMIEETENNSHFVEIGCYKGKSSFFMANSIKNSNKNIKFDCIDSWNSQNPKENMYNIFISNMKIDNILEYINPIKLDSIIASDQYKDESLDFIFIDADHSYENCNNDILHWFPKLKKGGYIGGHDYQHEGVAKSVNENFNNFEIIKSSWLLKK